MLAVWVAPELGKGRRCRCRERMAERHSFLPENSPRESWKEIIIFLLFVARLCLHSQAGSGSLRASLVWPRHWDQVRCRMVRPMGQVLAGAGQLSPVSLLLFLEPPPNHSVWSPPCCIPNHNNSQLLLTAQPLPSYLTIAKISSRSLSLALANQSPQLSTILPNCSSHLLITILPVQKPSWPLHTHHLLVGLHSRPPPLHVLAHVPASHSRAGEHFSAEDETTAISGSASHALHSALPVHMGDV